MSNNNYMGKIYKDINPKGIDYYAGDCNNPNRKHKLWESCTCKKVEPKQKDEK